MENNLIYWYCLYTRSRHEDAVYQRLTDKKIHTFLPKLEVWSRRKDRRKKIQKALFSGYLFVYENLTHQNWLEILKTPGVVKILGNEEGPMPIPEIQIESIRTILNGKAAVSPFPYLKEGQRVRVVDGPLKDCEGFLVKIKEDRERLIISIDLLKRSVSVEIEGASVEPVQ
ncbi:MAG: UpxY family transcription antiterminator [Deltaproteobacteria bacterium]|jgi:transcription antitermination factor NusG|nr:UpxY family transcription antiterminator [Deltaproteobacteria bacterium]